MTVSVAVGVKKEEVAKPSEIEIDFDSSHLIQFVPKYEEMGIIDIKEHNSIAFAQFLKEAK